VIAANILVFYALSLLITFSLPCLRYYQARFFSLVLLTFLSFLLAHFMPYPSAFYAVLAFFLAFSALSVYRNANIKRWFDPHVESAFLVTFSYFLFLRWLNPDVFGAEKFMDSAFISSVLHSPSLPPLDPFLAGYRLNCYYYFGHVIGASITLMSFSPVQYGYNIAIAAIAAYSASTLYGFLKQLGMKRPWIGVIFTLFTGDFAGFYNLLRDLLVYHRVAWLYYWNATRVIPGTINEFPYFSFLHADFHAHVVAIPVFLLAVSMLYSLFDFDFSAGVCDISFNGFNAGSKIFSDKLNYYVVSVYLIVLSYVLYMTNSWDSPVFLLLLLGLAVWLLLVLRNVRRSVFLLVVFLGCSISAFLAFTNIHSAAARIHVVKEHSPLFQFLLYFSIPVIFAYSWVLRRVEFNRKTMLSLLAAFAVSLALFARGVEITLVLLPLLALSLIVFGSGDRLREAFLALLVSAGCIFTILPEFIAIDCRMNTVFKFYEICWLLFCIPGSIELELAFDAFRGLFDEFDERNSRKTSRAVVVILIFMFATTLAYPAVATPQKCSVMRCTLNGMAFTKEFGEYNALVWAQKHVRGVVMSASYRCYTYGGRFPAFTGNPVVVGWACHEVQWRGNGRMLAERMLDVKLFYTDPVEYWKVLKKYNVSYVVLGYEERVEFNARRSEFLPLLGKVLKVVYEDRNVVIYRVLK